MSNAIPIIIEPREPERGKYRVAAYCRVSSSSDEQMHSYYAQVGYYKKNPDLQTVFSNSIITP